jgi:hypothetical protein
LNLWNFRQEGYDPVTQKAFRSYMSTLYGGNIAQLNNIWSSSYASFDAVEMPIDFNKNSPSWADLIRFRQNSIADFVAVCAKAMKDADPNHLITYSKLGLVFGPVDWEYSGEDEVTIVNSCKNAGYPLDFFAINVYASTAPGVEMRSGQWGIELVKRTGLPVLVTELGATATDTDFLDPKLSAGYAPDRQGQLIVNQIYSALVNGAMGVHVFTWEDREYLTVREFGFGIMRRDRYPKLAGPMVAQAFQTLNQIIEYDINLITGLNRERYDVAYLWSNQVTSTANRFLVEQGSLHGAMERLNLRVKYINETQLLSGAASNVKLLVLPLNNRMQAGDMAYINQNLINKGVSVYANVDPPGYQDYHVNTLSDFTSNMEDVFGMSVTKNVAYDGDVPNYCACEMIHKTVSLRPVSDLPPVSSENVYFASPWKYSFVQATSGKTLYTMMQMNNTDTTLYPAAVMKTHSNSKALFTALSFGEVYLSTQEHYDVMKSLLMGSDTLNISPTVQITGSGEVSVFYYEVSDGRALIEIMNWNDYTNTTVQLTIPNLQGRSIKDLRQGRKLISSGLSSNTMTVTMIANEVKLYVIGESQGASVDIIASGTTNIVIPNGKSYPVSFIYDTQNRGSCAVNVQLKKYGSDRAYSSVSTTVSGSGSANVQLSIPEYSRFDNTYMATSDGMNYYYQAQICGGAYATMPVLVDFVRPVLSLNSSFSANSPFSSLISYNFLPSFKDEAYRGLIGIFKSTKTAAVDSAHNDKVNAVASMLLSLGYQQSTADLSAYDAMKGESGPFFWVFDDVTTTYMGNLATSLEFLQRRMKVVIFAGEMVLSDDEVSSFTTWLADPTIGAAIVTTEGGYGSMASVFGVSASATRSAAAGSSISISNTSTPITSQMTSNSWNVGTLSGAGWSSLTSGKALGTYGDRPVFIMNRYGGGKTFAFNFDVTALNSDPVAKQVWNGVIDWASLDPNVFRLRWEVYCGGGMLGSSDQWLNNTWSSVHTPRTLNMKISPSGSCGGGASYKAYLYPWYGDYQKDAIGYYTSDNDTSGTSTTKISVITLLLVFIMFIIC